MWRGRLQSGSVHLPPGSSVHLHHRSVRRHGCTCCVCSGLARRPVGACRLPCVLVLLVGRLGTDGQLDASRDIEFVGLPAAAVTGSHSCARGNSASEIPTAEHRALCAAQARVGGADWGVAGGRTVLSP